MYLFFNRLVEEADYKATKELFGSKKGDDKNLENFIPKSESDFAEYAELVAFKLRPYEVFSFFPFHLYIFCIKCCGVSDWSNFNSSIAEKLPLYRSTKGSDEIIHDLFESSGCKRCCFFYHSNC